MKVALDHDSTLAATALVAFDLMGETEYTYDSISRWDWGTDKFGTARYLNALWHAWTLRTHDIQLMDDTVVEATNWLSDNHEVHIVTAHPDHMGISDGKKEWLSSKGIEYDEFHVVPTDQTKAALDYDVYIDDKPSLPQEVNEVDPNKRVFLRDQKYNRSCEGDYIRVNKLSEVINHLSEK